MSKPVSQFITNKGCVIQGVMKSENEINYVYCPVHKRIEHVYSFDREVDLSKPLHPKVKALIERLKSESINNGGDGKP